eukprot:SAG11_NODE_21209_length_429_cov_2.009091_1_plen_76_part_00
MVHESYPCVRVNSMEELGCIRVPVYSYLYMRTCIAYLYTRCVPVSRTCILVVVPVYAYLYTGTLVPSTYLGSSPV